MAKRLVKAQFLPPLPLNVEVQMKALYTCALLVLHHIVVVFVPTHATIERPIAATWGVLQRGCELRLMEAFIGAPRVVGYVGGCSTRQIESLFFCISLFTLPMGRDVLICNRIKKGQSLETVCVENVVCKCIGLS